MLRIGAIILFIILYFPYYSFSQTSIPNKIRALEINKPIKLDGILNEDCWKKADIISNFTQRELHEGQPVSEKTEVAIVYTKETLFIGIWCYDSEPDKLVAKEMKRDFDYWKEDNFEIIFDTFLDKRNGYVFVVNPNGARCDVQVSHQGESFNRDWNGIWDVAVNKNSQGWFAEMEIPFSTFKYPDTKKQIWGVNFERNIRRKREQDFWQGWSRNYEFEQVNHAGKLVGLNNIEGKENLELKPYITAGKEFSVENNGSIFNIGGDVNYLITPTLKLNLTANTDFAQVESDRMQINLTRFSLYYPEKRDFFLESRDFFAFNNNSVFYSRSIGIQGDRQIPILGGARVTGTIDNTNLGFISMQTAGKDSIPTTNYSVIRLKQNVLDNSSIGMILTAKNTKGHYNYTYGVDATYVKDDFLGNKNIYIGSRIAQSQTQGSTGKRNLSYLFYVDYPNDFIDTYTSITNVQRDYNPEMGFLRRGNYKMLRSKMYIMPRPDSISWIQKLVFKPIDFHIYLTDATNKLESFDYEIRPLGIRFTSGERFEFNIIRNYDRLDDNFELYDSSIIYAGDYWWTKYDFQFSTFSARRISGFINYSWGGFYNGLQKSLYTSLKFNVNKHLNLSADFSQKHIDLLSNSFTTNEIGGRIDYAFNPKTTSTIFGQWNNEAQEIILNFRFHWIPVIGSDFYLVINQTLSTDNSIIKNKDIAILSKLVWRFGI